MNIREALICLTYGGHPLEATERALINFPNAVETTKESPTVLVEMIRQAKVGG